MFADDFKKGGRGRLLAFIPVNYSGIVPECKYMKEIRKFIASRTQIYFAQERETGYLCLE